METICVAVRVGHDATTVRHLLLKVEIKRWEPAKEMGNEKTEAR